MSTLKDILQGIYDDRGHCEPTDVLDEARESDHPLHDRFTWDNTEAAEKWRLEEATRLIQKVKITVQVVDNGKPRNVQVRAFPNIPGEGYVPLEVVMERPDFENALLEQMRSEVKLLKRKYESHAALFSRVLKESAA